VAVVSTEPLTRDEVWHQGTPGSLWVFGRGALRATLPSGTADRDPVRQRPDRKSVPVPATRAA
ncbi:MAG TPA: class II glutamine amidotransferase, partial [Polyangia bacterium]|nr:class II glutamine amidotransferase [Polyangia bacterium]